MQLESCGFARSLHCSAMAVLWWQTKGHHVSLGKLRSIAFPSDRLPPLYALLSDAALLPPSRSSQPVCLGLSDGNWQKVGNYDGPLSHRSARLKFPSAIHSRVPPVPLLDLPVAIPQIEPGLSRK